MISDSEGARLVSLAREAVEKYLYRSIVIFGQDACSINKFGVFVTLNHVARDRQQYLRGCIGFPISEKRLDESVIEAAIAAATEDPRFPPVDPQELDNLVFEVSILTPPQEIKCNPIDYRKNIRIGVDGLILRWKYGSGLLLPQVAVEYKWNVDDFLANICHKAGAPPNAWRDSSCKLYRFQAIVFGEVTPKGKVVRHKL